MKIAFTRVVLLALFAIITMLQIFSLPGQFRHIRETGGASLLIEVLLTLLFFALFLTAQLTLFGLWKVIGFVERDEFFSHAAYIWLTRISIYLKLAPFFPIAIFLVVAPQADDPGFLVLLTAITLFLTALYLLFSILREQLKAKIEF